MGSVDLDTMIIVGKVAVVVIKALAEIVGILV
jgi:hypothetical protein